MDQKESRGAAQMDWEPLAFLMKSFSTIQRTGVGGLKKNWMRALFGFIWSVLLSVQIARFLKTHKPTALNLLERSELQTQRAQHQSENVLLFKQLRTTDPQLGIGSQGQVEGHFTSFSLSPYRHAHTYTLSPEPTRQVGLFRLCLIQNRFLSLDRGYWYLLFAVLQSHRRFQRETNLVVSIKSYNPGRLPSQYLTTSLFPTCYWFHLKENTPGTIGKIPWIWF